jgi:hypothetical protein
VSADLAGGYFIGALFISKSPWQTHLIGKALIGKRSLASAHWQALIGKRSLANQ